MTDSTDASFVALHDIAGACVRGGRAPGLAECGEPLQMPGLPLMRCWWLPHHYPHAHSWQGTDRRADLLAIACRQGVLAIHGDGDNMHSPAEVPSMADPTHREAAARALPLAQQGARLLAQAADMAGLHPAVASMLGDIADKARLWADLLPHMTGAGSDPDLSDGPVSRKAPAPVSKPTPKKGRRT